MTGGVMMFNLFGKKRVPLALAATANGRVKPLSEVTDPVFASGIMGAGYGIDLASDRIVSPVSGKVTMIANTLHGIGIHTEEGLDVLIHMGIDTVELKGVPFTISVKVGERVQSGQDLATMQRSIVEASGKSTTIIVVVTNSKDLELAVEVNDGAIEAGEVAAVIELL